jgi:GntR family histidine utilization transcriptional repressor
MSAPALPDVVEGVPAFERIKRYILENIHNGHWQEGAAVPPELGLAKSFGVSRMTVNRAMRELAAEGILNRVQGSGTFVAGQKVQSTLVEIKSIADEIRARGHQHRSELYLLERTRADAARAAAFGLAPGKPLFHSVIVHLENDVPIQVEDRWVQAALAPDYLQIDFARTTPNEYLMRVAPLQAVAYRIEALPAPRDIAEMLQISADAPCLVLHRSTRAHGQVASLATMWHPGARYQFAGGWGDS